MNAAGETTTNGAVIQGGSPHCGEDSLKSVTINEPARCKGGSARVGGSIINTRERSIFWESTEAANLFGFEPGDDV